MVKASIHGQTVRFTRGSGYRDSRKATESGRGFSETPTLETGNKVKLMDMAFISGRMGIDMRVNGAIVLSMVRDLTFLLMGMSIKELINLENLKALGSTNGRTVAFILGSSRMD